MNKNIDYSTMKSAIFDIDGTILDSMSVWEDAGIRYMRSKGIEPCSDLDDILETFSLRQSARYLIDEYNLPYLEDEIMQQMNDMVANFYKDEVHAKSGIKEYLQFLKNQEIRMCVATAADRSLVELSLKRCGILEYFDRIFTCTEVGIGKEQPDIYIKAAEFMDTKPEETWVFEDAYHAIVTAKNAGFNVVAVADDSSKKYRDKISEIADVEMEF